MPPTFSYLIFDDGEGVPPTTSYIGIGVAIAGNVLISLALNCQKLAHRRLGLEEQRKREARLDTRNARANAWRYRRRSNGHASANTPEAAAGETRPLLEVQPLTVEGRPSGPSKERGPRTRSRLALLPFWSRRSSDEVPAAVTNTLVDVALASDGARMQPVREGSGDSQSGDHTEQEDEDEPQQQSRGSESDYLRSKLWWLGFFLMNVGELGNFLSYAYAPASVVAPLGTFALISNCLFAPLLLKEKFRSRDLIGIALAVIGSFTIVSASKQSDVRLDPAALIKALQQRIFIVYSAIIIALGIVLGVLSEGRAGRRWVFVDVGLCALFGGYTVLSTKAISTLLSLQWIQIFKEWITYPVLAVLVGTGIGQIKYLNRALMKFDAKVVIPTQFVLFNLAAIVGSSILYRDFESVTYYKFLTFLYGCATTFLGVFLLTRPSNIDEGPRSSVDDGELLTSSPTRQSVPAPLPVRVLPPLKSRTSAPSLSLSPGQYLLIAASPPVGEGVRMSRGNSVESDYGSITGRRRTVHFVE